MKKLIVAALLSLCFSVFSNAQSAGISAYLIGSSMYYPQPADYSYYATAPLGHTNVFSPGLRMELNLMTPDRKVFHNNAIGVSYYFPRVDSAFYYADLKTDSSVQVLGTFRTSSVQGNIRSAYTIPFSFNDFLTINIGLGYGLTMYKTQYVLPEKSASFAYEESDFYPTLFTKQKSYGFTTELALGGLYEFEKFFLSARYCLSFEVGNYYEPPVRHALLLGIYLPLKRW